MRHSGYTLVETPDTSFHVDNKGNMNFWTTEFAEIIHNEFSLDLYFTVGIRRYYQMQYQNINVSMYLYDTHSLYPLPNSIIIIINYNYILYNYIYNIYYIYFYIIYILVSDSKLNSAAVNEVEAFNGFFLRLKQMLSETRKTNFYFPKVY